MPTANPLHTTFRDAVASSFLVVLAAWACAGVGEGADIYVAAAASGGGSGSPASPFQTIQAGVNAARPGDVVYIRSGTYRESITVAKTASAAAPLLITAYPGETPVVKGSLVVTGWVRHQGAIWRRDAWAANSQQVFVDAAALQQIGLPAACGNGTGSDGTTIITPVGSGLASMSPGTFYYDPAASALYAWLADGSDPGQHVLEASTQRRLLFEGSSTWVTVAGIQFRHTSSTAFSLGSGAIELGSDCTLRDCDVQWCDFTGVAMGYQQQRSQAVRVTSSNNGCLGFGASSSRDFTISGCTMAGNNYRRFNANWQAGGAKITSGAWGTIDGCSVHDNLGQGLWFDYANSGNPIVVRNCTVFGNTNRSGGIMIEVSKNVSVHDNLVYGNDIRGIYVAASDDVDVIANTVAMNRGSNAIDVSGMPRSGATLTNVRICNNLLTGNLSTRDLMMVMENGTDIRNLVSDHNLFHRGDGTARLWYGGDGRTGWKGADYTALGAWLAASNHDAASLQADPLCLAPATLDFRLGVGSPAIDRGQPVAYAVDRLGNPRTCGIAPDIGAYECAVPVLPAPPVVAAAQSAAGAIGAPFAFQVLASNAPTAFSAANLPAGLAIDQRGMISGTPTSAGGFAVTISAANQGGVGSATVSLAIDAPPVVASVSATAMPGGTTWNLSAVATDDAGEAALVYRWSITSAANAGGTFSSNDAHAASSVTFTAPAPGTYAFRVDVIDAQGSASSGVAMVDVLPVLTSMRVDPPVATSALNGTQAFTATGTDQFSRSMDVPATAWSVDAAGTVSAPGVFTAGVATGVAHVSARCGGVSAQALVTIIDAAPVMVDAAAAEAGPAPVTAMAVSALASDDGGAGQVTYTWSVVDAPAGSTVAFTPNGTTDAHASVASFTRSGDYTLSVVATDGSGQRISSDVAVSVAQTPGAILVSPATAVVAASGSQTFAASVSDQFGDALLTQPAVSWSVSGGGSIDAAGAFRAPGQAATATVVASSGGVSGTSSATVTAPITPLFSAKINFQPAAAAVPAGWQPDSGAIYGVRQNGMSYGWNAACESRSRTLVADPVRNTLVLMQAPSNPRAVWEMAVPNGRYQVHVVCGDGSFFDGRFSLNVEGVVAVTGTATSAVPFAEGTVQVQVSDGRLTLSNGASSYNTKICSIDLIQMPVGNG